ncbi:hypothetical protein AB0889_24140, partial [Streptomyces griseoaurantiacus]
LRWPISGALGETFANPDDLSGRPTLKCSRVGPGGAAHRAAAPGGGTGRHRAAAEDGTGRKERRDG